MTATKIYEYFCQELQIDSENIKKYKSHKDDGIDIFMKNGTILYFQILKQGKWILRKV